MSPRARKTTAQPDPERERLAVFPADAPPPAPVTTATDERRDRELEDILGELGSDGRIVVYHVMEGRAVYAGAMTIDGFSLEALLDTFGGGDKSLVIFQGRTKVETVRVSLDPSIPTRNPKSARLAAAQAAPAAAGVSDITTALSGIMTMSMQSMTMQQQMMTGMIAAVTSLLTARPEKDPMDVAMRMAELMKPAAGAAQPASEMFAILERGMNIGKSIASKGDDDGTMGVVKEGLGIVGKIVESAAANRAPALAALPPGVPVVLGKTQEPETAGAVSVSGQSDRPWVVAAAEFADNLGMASKFLTPNAAADTIASRLSDDALFDLLDDIRDTAPPGFYGRLVARFPSASSMSAEWLGNVVEVLLSMEEPDDDTAATNGTTPGAAGAAAVPSPS